MSKSVYKVVLIAASAAVAAGCTSMTNGPQEALTVAEEHPISVDSQTVTMTLDLADAATELSGVDKARLRAFAESYLQDGHGVISITAPSGSGADGAGRDAAGSIRQALYDSGVSWSSMSSDNYAVGQAGARDVILSYTHYVATPSACGIWEGLRERDYRNLRTPNFGCASQNNLAAMVGDPHDLIEPAGMTSPDSAFRIRGVKAFREGENTTSQADGDIETQIAE